MKLHIIAPNQAELTLNGLTIFFSYDTPVAFKQHGGEFFRTAKMWSRTTSRHITCWLNGASAARIPQGQIDALLAQA